MKNKFIVTIALHMLLLQSSNAQVTPPSWDARKVEEETYYTIGTQAHTYLLTPYMMYAVLYQSQKVPYEGYPDGVPFNVWTKVSALSNVRNSRTVMPNVNTLYASSWLDLRKEPILLDIPEFGSRYYSIGLQDAYMNYFSILGSRTIGGYGGKFMICGPDYHGTTPPGYTKVISPTPWVWTLMRIAPTYANDTEVAACRELQQKVTLTPLSQLQSINYNPVTYNEKIDLGVPDLTKNPLKFFEIAHKYIQINPPPEGEKALMALFKEIGLSPEQDFNLENLTEPQKKGLKRAMETSTEMINTYIAKSDNMYNGWTIQSKEMGNYGYSYLTRAALTMQSIGGFPWEEAIYVVGYKDLAGKELDGSTNNYRIHFNKDEIPQSYAFWSVTLYELPSVLLYNNPLDRYQMGPQIEGMKYNQDGSLDIYIQHDPPTNKTQSSNWLPAPAGKFVLSLRIYHPKPDMFQLDKYKVPLPGVEPRTRGSKK
jgi:hypothetical protein